MRTIKLTLTLITLTGLISLAGLALGTSSNAAAAMPDEKINAHWKGYATFSPTGAGPNVARCGAFPQFVEVTFAGSGIDNEGGILTNTVSACSNTATGEVFDLKATDTFQTGDQIHIESDPFLQVVDPSNCSVTNSHAIGFRVAGGTGKYAGATGHGRYHIAGNHTPCNGVTVPNAVWFEGIFQRP